MLRPREKEVYPGETQRLRPSIFTSTIFADVKIEGDAVRVYYPKDQDFIEVLRKASFLWNGSAWQLSICEYTGSAADRAADIAATLLRAGFPVSVPSMEIRGKVESGDYAPMHPRWIIKNGQWRELGFIWTSGDWYDVLNRLRGAKYVRGSRGPFQVRFTISAEAFELVEHLAEKYDFRLTPSATKLIDDAKNTYNSALLLREIPKPAGHSCPALVKYDVHPDLLDD